MWAVLIAIVTAGCGGEGQTGTVVGPAGGTVSGPNGAKVVIPPGALTTEVTINIEQTSDGAPALPGGLSAFGLMFAFTPHGTSFAVPVTVTLPFDATSVSAGTPPALYKTNTQDQWEQVANSAFSADTVTAQISSFSFAQVVIPPLDLINVQRTWSFSELRGDALKAVEVDGDTQEEGTLLPKFHDFGPAFGDRGYSLGNGTTRPPDAKATGFVFSSANGVTYWVATEAPQGNAGIASDPIGSVAYLRQTNSYRKNTDAASLKFTVTRAFIEANDRNDVSRLCPRAHLIPSSCDFIKGELDFKATASGDNGIFFSTGGGVKVNGDSNSWIARAWPNGISRTPLWSDEDFDVSEVDIDGASDAFVSITLRGPRTYTVDLSSIDVKKAFSITFEVTATTYNRLATGSEFPTGVGAYLRDPLDIDGVTVTTTGLEPIDAPSTALPVEVPVPPADCIPGPGPDPAAGVLELGAAQYSLAESDPTPTITVTRTGGSRGAVTATFTTSDATAIAGIDYEPVNATVYFPDGDAVERVVRVPLIQDLISGEPDKTLNLTLSQPGGCAALGAQTTAVMTIVDDDPLPPATHTVGGTVTGLVGTGLVLTSAGLNLSPGNGPFTFPQPLPVGIPYNVMVDTQPTNPNQICTVTNGSGTIGDADITNVAVDCVTAPTNGALDPGFGSGGKVTGPGAGATGMALQTDGKIVVAGGRSLSRYKTDGSPDTGFGTGGVVTVVFTGALDDARDVAIQPDGKIVVAGVTRGATQNDFGDFAVARYDASGSLDTSFGTGGKVTTDFHAGSDEASAVRIQTDGRIVVAGSAAASSSFPVDNDFAVARYTSAGILDADFGTGGKVSTHVAGRTDLVNAAVLQPDGKIVIAGRVADGSATEPDLCLVRYKTEGSLDMGFGNSGIVRTDLGLGNWEEATDLVMQPDGKIVVGALVVVGGKFSFGVARFDGAGALDGSFGIAGVATTAFPAQDDHANAVALQPDGKIVVAGRSPPLTTSDFAIARFDAAGMLDGSFGAGGKVTVDFFGGSDGAECVAVQPDGKIVMAGFAQNGANSGLALARLNP